MATASIMIRALTIMCAITTMCLLMALTSGNAEATSDLKHIQFNTQSKSYFDEIHHVSQLHQKKKYIESPQFQQEFSKISDAVLSLSDVFNKQLYTRPSENLPSSKSAANLLGSNSAANLLDSNSTTDEGEVKNLFISALDAVAANDSYSACVNDTADFIISLLEKQNWALQFLDAFGKPGPGLTTGRFNFVGSYSQCRAASGSAVNSTRKIHGNYCTLKVSLGPLAVQLGACLPDSCSEAENTAFVAEVIQMLNLTGTLEAGSTECHTDEREMTAATVVAIVLVVIIGLMMIFGTSFDIIFVQWPKWQARSEEENFMTNGLLSHQGYRILDAGESHSKDEATPLIGNRKPGEQSLCSKVLLAFSVYTNASKVLDTRQPSGSLSAIHGIRFLSMSWVLLGHTFVFGMGQFANLGTEFSVLLGRWTFDAIANALVSVDTFFALSGLLTAYLTLTEIKKKGLKINWPLYYFHRFWRLTPPYMLTIVAVLGFQRYLGSGALWPSVQPVDKDNCENNWWTNLLYVNNLVNPQQMCFGHSWYLANDMQFFLLSPLMIVPFFFHISIGVATCTGFLLICWITTGILSTQNDWPATLLTGLNANFQVSTWFTDYYITPWCRIGAYAVGVLAGCYLAIHNGKVRMNWYASLIGWVIATVTALAVVYGLRGDIEGDHLSSLNLLSFYNAVARSAWAACVCWVIIACASGHGGFVNSLLSWSPFVVLGRLTYMAYLIHPCLLYVYFQNQEQLYYITDTSIAVTYCGIVVLTNMIAFVLMLAFESPWIGLERVFLRRKQE